MSELWNERYSGAEYIYGKKPNIYFKKIIDNLPPGKVLVPGAGEGRDAVYAATQGWVVHAFDQSEKGKEKALKLADENNVKICYDVLDAKDFVSEKSSYDLIALVYFHLPTLLRGVFHTNIVNYLKPNGHLVLEAFNPKQIHNNSGGPKNQSDLLSSEVVLNDFKKLNTIEITELETFLEEGIFHKGKADIIRYLGILKS